MKALKKIYSNAIGISFFWNKAAQKEAEKIQLIVKEIGFLLDRKELTIFYEHTVIAISQQQQGCTNCVQKDACKVLLQTPYKNVDLAVTAPELKQIIQLLDQTICKLVLQDLTTDIFLN